MKKILLFIFFISLSAKGEELTGRTEEEKEKDLQESKPPQEKDVCKLPKDKGPCKALVDRFYFNSKTRTCEDFKYGGCEGNDNNFETKEQCLKKCETHLWKNVCKLPSETGPCEALFTMFFYNTKSKTCEEFTYGGCEGNDNRFETKEECLEKCCEKSEPPQENDVCKLPKDEGPCIALVDRFYFNSKTRTCENFTYGGCEGNDNNFETMEQCLEKCETHIWKNVCKLPSVPGPCKGSFPKFFYNTESNTCEEFIYGGCGGNDNRFETEKECMEKCCEKSGPPKKCPQNQKFYDCKPICNTCEFYGKNVMCKIKCMEGCFCDDNHVMRKDGQCVEPGECDKKTEPLPVKEMCKLPPKKGTGKCNITRYYYNCKSGACEKFTYGGCRGNANNFKTEEECQNKCIKCPPHSKFSQSGPACEGCGIRCLAIIEKPNCYCEPGYGRENATDICRKC